MLVVPAARAELPHLPTAAGHQLPQLGVKSADHTRFVWTAGAKARSTAPGCGDGVRAEPPATLFFPSRPFGPILPAFSREQ
eukprot:COSAG02_NODE_6960_length_3261_cov_11.863393_2_plen_81_part_00